MIKAVKGFTFLELMLTIMVLAVGITGIYKGMITLLDYQNQLTCRLYAFNLLDHEVALLEKRFLAKGEVPVSENGKTFQATLDFHETLFTLAVEEVKFPSLKGVSYVHLTLSWDDRDRIRTLKKSIVLVNPNIKLEQKQSEENSSDHESS